jgi:dipeptidyl aminopeptidase/acylaminoacyl peptidase
MKGAVTMNQQNSSGGQRRRPGNYAHLILMLVLVLTPWFANDTASASAAAFAAPLSQARIAIVGPTGATLFPIADGEMASTLAPGDTLYAIARSEDNTWVYVQTPDSDLSAGDGWVAIADLVLFGVASLPVRTVELPPQPAVAPVSDEPPVASTPITTPLPDPTIVEAADPPAEPISAAVDVTLPVTPAIDAPIAEVTSRGLNVRTGPGTQYSILVAAAAGDRFPILARNASSSWVQIELPDGGIGWVSAGYIAVDQPLVDLPVAEPPVNAVEPAAAGSSTLVSNLTVSQVEQRDVAEPATPASQPAAARAGPAGLSGKLVISTGNGGLFYLYNLATSELRPLTHGADPSISRDGGKIVFTRSGGEHGIYVINSDGSGERLIFAERELLSSPKWSPDGQWIVFSRLDGTYKCRDLGRNDICVSDREIVGSIPPGLSDEEREQIKQIQARILNNFDRQERPNWMLARIDANGGNYRDLAALNSALAPSWNEAGIVYQSKAGLERTADEPDATTQSVLSAHYLHDPDWQPGGGRIVYQQQRGSRWEIFSVNPDGSDNRVLTQPKTALVDQMPSNVAPAWSPDGQQIVFLSNREENGEAGQWRLWVMDADGGNQRPLPVDLPIAYNYVQEQMVSWGR